MRLIQHGLLCLLGLAVARPLSAGETTASLADLMAVESPRFLERQADRARLSKEMRRIETQRAALARRLAAQGGLPLRRMKEDGRVEELIDWADGRPLYYSSHNINAAITAAVEPLWSPPFDLDGAGLTAGMWDGGMPRASHREFQGRVRLMDSGDVILHATHVAGTLAAAGIRADAVGMAPAARIDFYHWAHEKSSLTARGAAWPGEPEKLMVANLSYGLTAGWNETGQASPKWEWRGEAGQAFETAFGRYNINARDTDAIAANAPYFLMVRSTGNDRDDNPGPGDPVALSLGGEVVPYDENTHPPGDGVYRDGYDTISYDAVAKNVLTVGAVDDAVLFNAGPRDLSKALMTSFSAWGPTDDGRIKPDVVANGQSVRSSSSVSDAAYGFLTGTSMAAPAGTGAAILLQSLFDRLFPGQAMLAGTVKGLIIHTADDLGNPGPDYRFGWGLINAEKAASRILLYAEEPGSLALLEDRLTPANPVRVYPFVWDETSPIRATLSWTDPPGRAATVPDNRFPRLIHNLDLRIVGPDGATHLPYVMPFVGSWDPALLDAPAGRGQNDVDNVEQVFLAEPESAGVYEAVVTFSGALTGGEQRFSLLLSGAAAETPLPEPRVFSVDPSAVPPETESLLLSISGENFRLGSKVRLFRSPGLSQEAYGIETVSDRIRCRVDLPETAAGGWHLEVTGPDAQTAVLPNALWIPGASGYAGWVGEHFTPGEIAAGWAEESADPDGDRLANLLEYALGTDPRVPDSAPFQIELEEGRPVFLFTRRSGLADVETRVEVSHNLTVWHTADLEILAAGDPETVLARPPPGAESGSRLFWRLRALR